MKKLLLTLALLFFTANVKAQNVARVQMDNNSITFYDMTQKKYIPSFEYKKLYGDAALNTAIDRAIEDNSIQLMRIYQGVSMYYHRNTNKYYTYDRIVALFGQENADNIVNDINARNYLIKAQTQIKKNKRAIQENSKIIVKSNNLVIGCSMIGGALGIYAIGNEIINSKMSKETDVDKLKKMRSSSSAVAWVSGAVSVAGVVVILTGIQKVHPEGFEIAKNTYIDSSDAGLKLTMKF